MPSGRQRRRVSLPCARCGAPFEVRPGYGRLFCSRGCATAARWSGGYRLSPRSCVLCDESFVPRGPAQKVCDDARCREASRRADPYSGRRTEVARMVRNHDGVCDACGGVIAPVEGHRGLGVVDHCHETGAIRGILHLQCNASLGNAADDRDRMFAWQVYLARHQFDLRDRCVAA